MSLRGSETTEAISEMNEFTEIATLPAVARNDQIGIGTPPLRGEGKGLGTVLAQRITINTFNSPATTKKQPKKLGTKASAHIPLR